jgi:DNA-binding transcriptional LysR family regulator
MHITKATMYNMHMNLHQIDLNLLVLFDALYRHRSVTAAAREVCLSQSAFSHGLSRLRTRLDDDLFIRINNVMQPTNTAVLIAEKLSTALPLVHSALNNSIEFDPANSEIEFKFVATDYTEFSLLPRLIAKLQKLAPKIKITVYPTQQKLPLFALENGEIDFALGFSHQLEESNLIDFHTWLHDDYCTIACQNNNHLNAGLTLQKFIDLPHVLVSPWGERKGVVDEVLADMRLHRHIALQLPNVLVAPYTLIDTDLLLTMPRLMATKLVYQEALVIYDTPIKVPDYQLNLYWHRLNSSKASHIWLRKLVTELT